MSGILPYRCDPPAEGACNMAEDELLAESLPPGGVALRFYAWSETTLSLGTFQRIEELDGLPTLRQLPVVRRPSGGGAILHGTDLTYAIAVCRSHPWGAVTQRLYDGVHGAVVALIREMGLEASLVPSASPSERPVTVAGRGASPEPYLCFDRRSPGDVVVAGHKLLGSAQRRHRAAVVQHGSLLLRSVRSGGASSGGDRLVHHEGLEDLLGRSIDASALKRAWVERVAGALGLVPQQGPQSLARPGAAGREAAVARYRDPSWTRRR